MATVRRKALWDAIHQYAAAVGGDPAKGIYGATVRCNAVVAVEQAVDSELAAHFARAEQLFADNHKLCKQIRGLERDKSDLRVQLDFRGHDPSDTELIAMQQRETILRLQSDMDEQVRATVAEQERAEKAEAQLAEARAEVERLKLGIKSVIRYCEDADGSGRKRSVVVIRNTLEQLAFGGKGN